MALASMTKARQTVSVWVSGSHRQVNASAKQALIVDDQQADVSQDAGHQHEAAYKSLINVMLREHRSATTDLIIETGNDVIHRHLLGAKRPAMAHLARNWEIVASLKELFDSVRLAHYPQEKARPVQKSPQANSGHSAPLKLGGKGRRVVLARPSTNADGHRLHP